MLHIFLDEPNILIKGSEKVICGETAQFDAEVEQKPPNGRSHGKQRQEIPQQT